MQTNLEKCINKICISFGALGAIPKALLKYGSAIFLAVFAAGTLLYSYNRLSPAFSLELEFAAINIVKISIAVLAEAVLGALIMDFAFNRK